ncbi:MAG: CrcB family protein [Micrococcus sp.]|nr:CrcB family protein [Micrococcus sp.]
MSILAEGSGAGAVPWLMLAGAVGAVLRLACDRWLPRRGILLANVAGSLAAGLVIGIEPAGPSVTIWVTGLAGALTTFSTVSAYTAEEVRHGRWRAAVGSWALHLGSGGLAVVLGLVAGAALSAP